MVDTGRLARSTARINPALVAIVTLLLAFPNTVAADRRRALPGHTNLATNGTVLTGMRKGTALRVAQRDLAPRTEKLARLAHLHQTIPGGTILPRSAVLLCPAARACAAGIVDCAGVTVITWCGVVGVLAAHSGVAAVRCARLLVIAIEFLSGNTFPGATCVLQRTLAAVLARSGVVEVDTAHLGVARVVGAHVAIVAY